MLKIWKVSVILVSVAVLLASLLSMFYGTVKASDGQYNVQPTLVDSYISPFTPSRYDYFNVHCDDEYVYWANRINTTRVCLRKIRMSDMKPEVSRNITHRDNCMIRVTGDYVYVATEQPPPAENATILKLRKSDLQTVATLILSGGGKNAPNIFLDQYQPDVMWACSVKWVLVGQIYYRYPIVHKINLTTFTETASQLLPYDVGYLEICVGEEYLYCFGYAFYAAINKNTLAYITQTVNFAYARPWIYKVGNCLYSLAENWKVSKWLLNESQHVREVYFWRVYDWINTLIWFPETPSYFYVINYDPYTATIYKIRDTGTKFELIYTWIIPYEDIYDQYAACYYTAPDGSQYIFLATWDYYTPEALHKIRLEPEINVVALYFDDPSVSFNVAFAVNNVNFTTPKTLYLPADNYTFTAYNLSITVNDTRYHFYWWNMPGKIVSQNPTITFTVTPNMTGSQLIIYYDKTPKVSVTACDVDNPSETFNVNFYAAGENYTTPAVFYIRPGAYPFRLYDIFLAVDQTRYDFCGWSVNGENVSRRLSVILPIPDDADIVILYRNASRILAPLWCTIHVKSNPELHVNFSVDGLEFTTPVALSVPASTYQFAVLDFYLTVNDVNYVFTHWTVTPPGTKIKSSVASIAVTGNVNLTMNYASGVTPVPPPKPTVTPEEETPTRKCFPLTFYIVMSALTLVGLYLFYKRSLWMIAFPLTAVILWLLLLKPCPPWDFYMALILTAIVVGLLLNKLEQR